MPRVRADDYDAKAQLILDSAAALFAKAGYPNAKMQDIAQACGATKSMLYHYFPTKDHLLFAMLEEHLEKVLAGMEEVSAQSVAPRQRLAEMVRVYTSKSTLARRRHITAMNDIKYLPRAMQASLLALEVKITNLVANLMRELNPELPEATYKIYTMLLIGMLTWTDLWFKPTGKIKPGELCERASRLFLKGFLAERR